MDGRMVPVDLDEDAPNGEFDNLYLDMNGIIHPCCHPEDGPAPEDEEHMYENIFLYLDRLIRIVRPKKLLYMAIDGVAPRAKMNQQRARRFRAAQEREEMSREQEKLRQDWEAEGRALPNRGTGKFFDSNVITPGSMFLHKMSEAIRYFIHDRTSNDPLWQKLKFRVILSDANIPSEGEHKLMDYIRHQRSQPEYNPNIRHCLYGADADLIMLGLATHEAHFSIIREVVMPKTEKKCSLCGGNGHVASECTGENEEVEDMGIQKPFQILSIPIMRQYLMIQFSELENRMPDSNPYDFERCVDDFVFMCFFVGNDFLPHLPSLSIRDGSIDQMLSLYVEILPSMEEYMTNNGQVNLPQVEQFLEFLGGIEDQVFKNALEREAKRRSELEDHRMREEAQNQNAKDKAGKDSQMGGDLAGAPAAKKAKAPAPAAQASDTNAWHAQLLAQSFSMDLDNLENAPEGGAAKEEPDDEAPKPKKPMSGKFVAKEFHAALKARLEERQDLGVAMADTVRLGEGPHWKQRYYAEKFKVKQDDLVDFLQRIRKAYIEGLCWVMVYYYQGCQSWTWFYPYHYAPFASDLIGCAGLKSGDLGYFQVGKPFMPFQQLMSVLPPGSSEEAGIPVAMRELMTQPFSPIIDFYPEDFGLDLNGKRFTWQAVILLPFIDEPRLVRILAPLLKLLGPIEKIRNRRGQELIFGNKDDKTLFQAVQLAQAAFEAGRAGTKQTLNPADSDMFGHIEGWQFGGANRQVVSPIEGLPDVEESHAVCAQFYDPEGAPHVAKMLPGIREQVLVVNAADFDEASRLKGFGGEPAKRLILQALGKDPDAKPDKGRRCFPNKEFTAPEQAKRPAPPQAAKRPKAKAAQEVAAPVAAAPALKEQVFEYEEDESEFGGSKAAPAPPAGSRVIRVHSVGAEKKPQKKVPKAPEGFKPVRNPGAGSRGAPY